MELFDGKKNGLLLNFRRLDLRIFDETPTFKNQLFGELLKEKKGLLLNFRIFDETSYF